MLNVLALIIQFRWFLQENSPPPCKFVLRLLVYNFSKIAYFCQIQKSFKIGKIITTNILVFYKNNRSLHSLQRLTGIEISMSSYVLKDLNVSHSIASGRHVSFNQIWIHQSHKNCKLLAIPSGFVPFVVPSGLSTIKYTDIILVITWWVQHNVRISAGRRVEVEEAVGLADHWSDDGVTTYINCCVAECLCSCDSMERSPLHLFTDNITRSFYKFSENCKIFVIYRSYINK